jgi:hypothetical protein
MDLKKYLHEFAMYFILKQIKQRYFLIMCNKQAAEKSRNGQPPSVWIPV